MKHHRATHLIDRFLCVTHEDIQLIIHGYDAIPWSSFVLNPRRLRGSDFLMRWSQGVWSEKRLVEAVKDSQRYFAVPYGPSGTAPSGSVREFELYFERLEKAGLGDIKRPDLLVFPVGDHGKVNDAIAQIGGVAELPFTREDDARMRALLDLALIAVECENSLWRAAQMPDFKTQLKPQRRLGGRLGLRKNAVLPTVIIKEEDRDPLRKWQTARRPPIHIWHVFYDLAFGLPFNRAEDLITGGQVEPTPQVFQAPGGATTRKMIYKFYYHFAYPLARAVEEPTLVADSITDKNGHILPYVRFEGGRCQLTSDAIAILDDAAKRR